MTNLAVRYNARLEERTRIARELHDTLLQTFISASMQLGVTAEILTPDSAIKSKLDRILVIMRRGIEDSRIMLEELRSSDHRRFDLVHSLSLVQRELDLDASVDFRVKVDGERWPLPSAVEREAFSIGKEALVNAFTHSKSKWVELKLEYTDRELQLCVRDGGGGIEPHIVRSGREGHWGLSGMRERAARIRGQLDIFSSPLGTTVALSIPKHVCSRR